VWCTNHPGIETERACSRCARPFCEACLAELLGRSFCAGCKEITVRQMQSGRERNPQAVAALVVSIVGVVLCSSVAPIVSTIGLVLGLRSLADSRLRRPAGRYDMEWASIVLSGGTLALWVVGLLLGVVVWLHR
jgi:hypothetical protein